MKTRSIVAVLVAALVVGLMLSGCGRARQAVQMAQNVAEIAGAAEKTVSSAEGPEEYELSETNVRRFYQAVQQLESQHPDIDFEVAMTAAIEAVGAGVNLEQLVERETNLSFDEYGGLSTALMLVQTEAVGVRMTREIVATMEESLSEHESVDQATLSEEEKGAIEQQRIALDEAREELESPEFVAAEAQMEMIARIRSDFGY